MPYMPGGGCDWSIMLKQINHSLQMHRQCVIYSFRVHETVAIKKSERQRKQPHKVRIVQVANYLLNNLHTIMQQMQHCSIKDSTKL